ncbi:MAG: alpha/beta hydrolase [Flavobacteriales bacterium]|nr:alpha/beta hydrolase [Flavobacteriales bacterium]
MNRVLIFSLLSICCISGYAQKGKPYVVKDYTHHRSQQMFIEVEGGKMAYLDVGEGIPILMVHGVPTSSWLFRHMIADLSTRGFRVIAPDLLGFGSSDKPKDLNQYDFDKQAQRILDLMQFLEIGSWSEVIHDVGGLWTWELLKIAPNAIDHLVILNTIIDQEGFKPPIRFRRKGLIGRFFIRQYRSFLFGKMVMKRTLKYGMVDYRLSKSDEKGYWLPMKEGANKAVFHFFSSYEKTCSSLEAYQHELGKLKIRTMVFWGKEDDILKGKEQIALLKEKVILTPEKVLLVGGIKHFIQEEQPVEICDEIFSFIISKEGL